MIKRAFDIFFSFFGLLAAFPILLPVIFLVWLHDKKLPFYVAPRVGRNNKIFKMVKLRSMEVNADKSGVNSTSKSDKRITPVGYFIRNYKLDELTQLWNVFIGDMSLVGPRPNVKIETDSYTYIEKRLLSVRPGITDFSSIVFSDEGDILDKMIDPDLSYNQLIRPWKSRLGLIYIDNQSASLDLKLVFYTIMAIFSKHKALNWVVFYIEQLGVDTDVVNISKRDRALYPFPPPGADEIFNIKIR
jgi:lipopolysaccharide/colanic/teichoic acid biosynthesis glycosyltransferase